MERGQLFLLRLSVRTNDMTRNMLDLGDLGETRMNKKPNLMRLAWAESNGENGTIVLNRS